MEAATGAEILAYGPDPLIIRVGDTVTAAGCTGAVEAVNLRTTVLRDADGRTHIIPNSAITRYHSGSIRIELNFPGAKP